METSLFTFFRKYRVIFIIFFITFLAGCSGTTIEAIDANSTGFFDHYFIYPFSLLIKIIAGIFNENYGLSIIIITLIIRLILMPFFLRQTKSGIEMRHKMAKIKPEMDVLQSKYKNKKDKDSQLKMQQEMMQLYQKHNMNPLASFGGCLPILIQFPILIGVYYAIRRTPEIASHSFLWFDLGQTNIILTIIAVVIYFIQFKVSLIGMDPQMKKQMNIMGMMSPLMIGFISLSAPAALPLYWSVGGIFMIVQTIIIRKMYPVKHN